MQFSTTKSTKNLYMANIFMQGLLDPSMARWAYFSWNHFSYDLLFSLVALIDENVSTLV